MTIRTLFFSILADIQRRWQGSKIEQSSQAQQDIYSIGIAGRNDQYIQMFMTENTIESTTSISATGSPADGIFECMQIKEDQAQTIMLSTESVSYELSDQNTNVVNIVNFIDSSLSMLKKKYKR